MSSTQWPPEGSAVPAPLSASDWSAVALGPLHKWPCYWQLVAPAPVDAGPGKRSGEGSVTVLPYVVKSLAGKLRPDDLPGPAS